VRWNWPLAARAANKSPLCPQAIARSRTHARTALR
jgi:hypothetical protein